MRKLRLAAFITLGVVACGGDEPAVAPLPPPPPGSITGQVLLFDGVDHSNTTVTMVAASKSGDTSTNVTFRTTTDPSGAFELKNVPPGTYVTTYTHETYVDVTQPNIVVSDSTNGRRTLDRAILTRAAYVVDGLAITPGNRSPLADRQFFNVDGQLGIYDQDSGVLGMFPRTLTVVGGTIAPDAKNALLLSGSSASVGATDALYAARIDTQPFATPVLVSANAVQAGVSPNSQRAFVFTSTGNPGDVDLWSFAFADPKAATKVAGDITFNTIVYASDPTYPTVKVGGAIPYSVPVYGQLGYNNNPHLVAGVSVTDFTVFDVNAGGVTKFPNVFTRTSLPIPAGSPPGTQAMQLIISVPDAAALQRDVYLWNPGVALPLKVNAVPLPAASVVDTSSSPGRAFIVSPNVDGGAAVSVFDLSATPNLRSVVSNLLWSPGANVVSSFATRGRAAGANKYYVLGRNGTGADLLSVDLSTFTSNVVQPSLTKVSGLTFSSSDDLTISGVARTLTTGTFLVNIASNGAQLTPVLVDGNGPHAVTGLYSTASFSSLIVNETRSALAFLDTPTSAVYAAIPANGPATPNVITLPAATEAIALSRNGQRLAFSAAGAIRTTDTTGNAPLDVGTASTTVNRIHFFDPAIVAVTNSGSVHVGAADTAASLMTLLASGGFGASPQAFADGTRVLVQNGLNTYELPTAGATPTIATTYTLTTGSVAMNGAKTQAAILQSGGVLTLLLSNGTKDVPPGSWAALPANGLSPDGKKMYFRDSAGRIIAADPLAAAAQVATASISSTIRSLNGGADFVFMENTATGRDVVAVNANTATRTVVATNALGLSAFGSGPSSSLTPWVSPDGTTVVAAGNANTTAGAPANIRLSAYTTALVQLGDNVASAPAPTLDATGKNLLFQTNRDSLFGTGTLASYPLGGTAPVVLAEKVRDFAFSPDQKSLAIISVQDGVLVLASGPVGQPATPMGKVGFTDLTQGTNLFFSDDGLRLFAIDAPSTGGQTTNGILWTGAVGSNALSGVTTDVIGVFPDRTGKQAAVLTKNLAASGAILNRFRAQ